MIYMAVSDATVTLRCEPPVGSPPPNITGHKNDEPFFFSCGRSLSAKRAENVELIIKGVRANDSGDYQCVNENMAALRKGPFITLKVLGWSCFSFLFQSRDTFFSKVPNSTFK